MVTVLVTRLDLLPCICIARQDNDHTFIIRKHDPRI